MNDSAKRHHALIIHPGALGDVLLALPAIRMIRRSLASHELVLVAQNRIGRLLRVCGEVDQVWSTEGAVLSALYTEQPALPVPIRDVLSRTTHVVGWLPDSDRRLARNFRNLGIQHVQLLSPKNTILRSCHMSERYMETLQPWGRPFEGGKIAFSPLTMHGAGRVDDVRGTRTVFLHPGSGSPHKCLPCEPLGRLVRAVARDAAIRVVICEGPDDRDAVGRLLNVVGETPHAVLRGKTLEEMARLLTRADVFLGHDSGLTHLAAARGVPTVAIFGPTNPDQWRPLGKHVVVHQGPVCRCRTWSQVQQCRDRVCLPHSVEAWRDGITRQLASVRSLHARPMPMKWFTKGPVICQAPRGYVTFPPHLSRAS